MSPDQKSSAGAIHARRKDSIASVGGGDLISQSRRLIQRRLRANDFLRAGIIPGLGDNAMLLGIGAGRNGCDSRGRKGARRHPAIGKKRAVFHQSTEASSTEL